MFEFDMGYALWIPNAAGSWIHDEETFTIDDGLGTTVTFEFDNFNHPDGGIAGVTDPNHVAISIAPGLSTGEVVAAITTAINNAAAIYGLQITPIANDNNRIFLLGAVDVTQHPSQYTTNVFNPLGDVVILGNAPGSVSANAVSVPLNGDMTSTEVATIITKVVNQHFSGGDKLQASEPGTFNDGARFSIEALNVRGEFQTVTFEFDTNGFTQAGNVAIDVSAAATADDVAVAIETAINDFNATSSPQFRLVAVADGDEVTLNGPNGDYTRVVSITGTAVEHVNPYETTIKRDKSLGYSMRLFGQTVGSPGPLGYSASLTGDHPSGKSYGSDSPGDRYTHMNRNRDNHYEGVFIDDLIVGFAERGELATAATSGVTGFTFPTSTPGNMVSVGDYQLEIRRGEDFAVYQHDP